jgi:ribonuclease MRP protein subunit RMP1
MPIPKEELTSVHQILHLTHHRNKNQHRLSKWYKSFSQLRRQVAKLITELEALEVAEIYSTGSGKGKGKGKKNGAEAGNGENKYVKAAREKVELRVKFLGEWLVGGCFL